MPDAPKPKPQWRTCTGVVREGFHILCVRRADASGLCKRHRQAVAEGHAQKPPQAPRPP